MSNEETNTERITTIQESVMIGTHVESGRIWFRGHPEEYNNLTPRIFRREFDSWWAQLSDFENHCSETFKKKAPSLSIELPPPTDHLRWLFIMQHHGMPTRLLDWTESILVALFFAVSTRDDSNGELWTMNPRMLNKCIRNDFELPMLNNPELNYLINEPLVSLESRAALAQKFGLADPIQQPIALEPPLYFRRMLAQLSVFTVHPKSPPAKTLPQLLEPSGGIKRFVIPNEFKPQLRLDLEALGIREWTLFPDLDSLSKQIRRTLSDMQSLPLQPPTGNPFK